MEWWVGFYNSGMEKERFVGRRCLGQASVVLWEHLALVPFSIGVIPTFLYPHLVHIHRWDIYKRIIIILHLQHICVIICIFFLTKIGPTNNVNNIFIREILIQKSD